jgi:hypothetical protein
MAYRHARKLAEVIKELACFSSAVAEGVWA